MRTIQMCLICACVALPPAIAAAEPVRADFCSRRMGPYGSSYEAESVALQARGVGYETSGVWGEGGIVSQWSNRHYYFNVFFRC